MTPNCPFCGAARKRGCGFEWFKCGTMTAPANNNRRDQTQQCVEAEVARLTKERDDARKLDVQATQHCVDVMNERDAALVRIKRLEEAGDRMRKLCADGDDCDAWDAAKEAKL
jgi:hypothetical protein